MQIKSSFWENQLVFLEVFTWGSRWFLWLSLEKNNKLILKTYHIIGMILDVLMLLVLFNYNKLWNRCYYQHFRYEVSGSQAQQPNFRPTPASGRVRIQSLDWSYWNHHALHMVPSCFSLFRVHSLREESIQSSSQNIAGLAVTLLGAYGRSC